MTFVVDPSAYEAFMGPFATPLASQFADFGGVAPGQRVLDVGAGTGILTAELVRRVGDDSVVAVDPSPPFVGALEHRFPAVTVARAAAEELPFEDESFDAVLAQLVVQFMTEPVAGLTEMARVARPGAAVSACVWDHGGGKGPLSPLWRAARKLDAGANDESQLAGVREGDLVRLFRAAGLRDVDEEVLTVSSRYPSFEAWWEPYTMGVGPAGAYVAGLGDERRAELRELLRQDLPEPPFEITASAWSVRGLG
jgi:SAM-dependent methyltransferase